MRVVPLALALALTVLPASAAGLKRLQGFKIGPLPASVLQLNIQDIYRAGKANPKPMAWFDGTFRPVHVTRFAVSTKAIPVFGSRVPADQKVASRFVMPIFDLQRRQFVWPTVDFAQALPDPADLKLLTYDDSSGQGTLFVSTLHHKATETLLRTSRAPDGGIVNEYKNVDEFLFRTYFAHWDLASGTVDWIVPLQDADEPHGHSSIGIDPSGRYFYFAAYKYRSYDPEKRYASVPIDAVTISRLDVTTRTVDWSHTVPLPGRDVAKQVLLGGITVFPSHDYTKFSLVEYVEPSHGKINPPPQGWIVDVPSASHYGFEIPRLAYGVTFDRQNRYCVIGSHSEGKLYRYDLATKRRDLVTPAFAGIQRAIVSADNRTLYVMGRRVIEQRSWPDLKLVRSYAPRSLAPGQVYFEPEGLAIMPDGKTLVMNDTESGIGAATQTGIYLLGL